MRLTLRLAEGLVYLLLVVTILRGLLFSQAGDLVFTGLMGTFMGGLSWRLRAEGFFKR